MPQPLRLLFIAALAAGAFFLAKNYVAEPFYVASASMEPTLSKDDHMFLDKLTFHFRLPRRGEIIAFGDPEGRLDKELVKRIIALPGDTVEVKEKQVYVNGQKLFEPYTQYVRQNEKLQGDNLERTVVPPGSLFVLGDNRDLSADSLSWKNPETGERILFVNLRAVTGKVRGAYAE
ncbi:MAG TPA: signal peptidase I [Elusimicrobiales bacterium]|nr:signal peptidase I [Elusimicrobiales bacterium]